MLPMILGVLRCIAEVSSPTPHAADGRCRHAACRARGAPARRGGDRGHS
jgi:hypothetical protein